MNRHRKLSIPFPNTLFQVSRCLGLPCRVITNYNSAHDTDHNLSIELYYNSMGESLSRSEDSIWNFHCWNESWYLRSDLGNFYSGWQVWDSTPQEKSDGLYQLGPTSQRAVKEGEVDMKFDTPFVFAEVNADVIIFIEQNNGRVTKGPTRENYVGQLICTKAVGQKALKDISLDYKYQEGSSKEREIYSKARRKIRGAQFEALMSTPPAPQVTGKITVSGTPTVGEDINVTLTLTNMTSDNKAVTVNLSAAAIVYNNIVRRPILNNSEAVQLGPNEEKGVPLQIKYSQYDKQLTSDKMIHITAVYKVENMAETFVETNIVLLNPPLQIKALKTAILDSPMVVEVTFMNPLSTPVTGCVFKAEGSGLTKDVVEKNMGQLEPGQKTSVKIEFIPYMVGEKELLVILTCDKFKDIKGHLSINVQSSSRRLRACCV
ncbi:hypothetical protein XELAEV_18043881mg [Xenopus laevis]|uniref:Transglutaminase-like domain-containing protein n=1 Tax=Xenopus laevis TaxID=8355 RepID=A0A974BYE4_XENLA|nr:hypothetical protein XELAEV_18043881mg [Xenopus laevis]